MTEQEQIQRVSMVPFSIRDIENPSEKVQLAALERNIYAFSSIQNPTFFVQLETIKKIGALIRYIKSPEQAIKKAAVQQNGTCIQYIVSPDEEIKILAVQQKGEAIEYIQNPSEEIQIAAVKQNPNAYAFIKAPSKRVKLQTFLSRFEQKQGETYQILKIDSMFDALGRREKERFLLCLPEYKEALEEKEYFEGLLRYLILYRNEWVQEYIDTNAPLTTDQENIWKKHRLKTLV